MTITRAAAVVAASVLLTACATGGDDEPTPELDLSTIREPAWTVTADQIADAKDARMGTIGGLQSVNSVTIGNLVVSAAASRTSLALAGIDARSGEIAWRRELPVDEDSWWTCEGDDGGTNLACMIGGPDAKTSELSVIDQRTGTVRKAVEIDANQSFAIDGDDLYLTTFTPADQDRRLDVAAERRSWSTGKVAWRAKTSFALEGGWGHDGGQGFEIGASRVIAYSAAWEVVLDKRTGRLLGRSDSGRYEEPLDGGGWLISDSGDGGQDEVTITLFSSTGEPLAEDRLPAYYFETGNIDQRLVSTGRHLRDQSTGRSLFEAPKGQQIATVTDAGRVVLTEPAGSEHGEDEKLTYQVWDVQKNQRRGTVDVQGDWMSDVVSGGQGVLLISERYDEKSDQAVPSTLTVIDTRKPGIAATIDLGWKIEGYNGPSIIRTRAGAAVTGATGVKGLVVPQ
jgi:hypothetical protein